MTRERRSTVDKGRVGERRAETALVARGYTIVERNFRCRRGELDLIARDGDVLVFVEVRSRADGRRGSALATIGAVKQRQLARVAEAYLAIRRVRPTRCRFDVVGITGDEVTVVVDAFRLGV